MGFRRQSRVVVGPRGWSLTVDLHHSSYQAPAWNAGSLQAGDSDRWGLWAGRSLPVDGAHAPQPFGIPPSRASLLFIPGQPLIFPFFSSFVLFVACFIYVRNPKIHFYYFCFNWSTILKRILNKRMTSFIFIHVTISGALHFLLVQIFFCMKD